MRFFHRLRDFSIPGVQNTSDHKATLCDSKAMGDICSAFLAPTMELRPGWVQGKPVAKCLLPTPNGLKVQVYVNAYEEASGMSTLMNAVEPTGVSVRENSKMEMIKTFLGHPALVLGHTDKKGRTALHYACGAQIINPSGFKYRSHRENGLPFENQRGDKVKGKMSHDCTELLLKKGKLDVNKADKDGFTPLMYAIGSGYNETVILLLQKGADASMVANTRIKHHARLIAKMCDNKEGLNVLSEMKAAEPKNEIKIIRPLNPEQKLAFGSRKDETSMPFWNQHREPYTGKIVFGKQKLQDFFEPDELNQRFSHGDEIHARAVWAHAIRNIPMYIRVATGEPGYLPPVEVEPKAGHLYSPLMIWRIAIDGKLVSALKPGFIESEYEWGWMKFNDPELKGVHGWHISPTTKLSYSAQRKGEYVTSEEEKIKSNEINYYTHTQTAGLRLVGKFESQEERNFTKFRNIPFLSRQLSRLPQGDHKVDVELCFSILVNNEVLENCENRGVNPEHYPIKAHSPVSFPIAKGSFIYHHDSKEGPSVSAYPLRKSKMDEKKASALEEQFGRLLSKSDHWGSRQSKTEQVLDVCLASDTWVVDGQDHRRNCLRRGCNCPRDYRLDFNALLYRSPETGWDEEHCATFPFYCWSNTRSVNDHCRFRANTNGYVKIEMSQLDVNKNFENGKRFGTKRSSKAARMFVNVTA